MKVLKMTVAAVAVALSTGCAVQPSTYEDRSTPGERNIRATGAAAVEAAKSNRSTNANIESNGGVGFTVYDANGNRDRSAEAALRRQRLNDSYSDYTRRRLSNEFDWRMKRKINNKVRRFMDNLFD